MTVQARRETDAEANRDAIWAHARSIGICMMVTRDGGALRSRPMTPTFRTGQNAVWFLTDAQDHKDDEIAAAPEGCLAFADPRGQCYVSMSGRLSVVREQAMIDALWNDEAAAFFPQGKDDPSVILLRFDPEMGEYWDAYPGTIARAYAFVASAVTGERPVPGETGRANMG
jgi:general stress protein 26